MGEYGNVWEYCRQLVRHCAWAAYAAILRIRGRQDSWRLLWEVLGGFGKVWVHCRPLQQHCAWLQNAAKPQRHCVYAGGHYPACRWQERSVNRLQRALPASHTHSYIPILSHNLSCGTSGFVALRRDKQAFAPQLHNARCIRKRGRGRLASALLLQLLQYTFA